MSTVGILLLAGGASSRMLGPDKVLEQVRGLPLLTDRAIMCQETNAQSVVVVTAPDKPERKIALKHLDVEIVDNGGSYQGLSHSMQIGLRHITQDAVLIVLADLPDLTTDDLNTVIARASTSPSLIIRGTSEDGKPGHPVLIKRAIFDDIYTLRGDQGAAPILAKHAGEVDLIQLPGTHATADLDTPEAWENWRLNN